ncbi:MAG: hypothetical protein GEU81_14700 [Nitriliruptorales bacterium]|nr:hypothetical protein [Nitriliruptorales bacterium]
MRRDDLQHEFDEAYRQAVAAGERFGHRQHLHVAWLLMRRLGLETGADAVAEGVRRLTGLHGERARHQASITSFWTRLIAQVQQMRPDLEDFESALRAFPLLLDLGLFRRPRRGATNDTLAARKRWVTRDLTAFP